MWALLCPADRPYTAAVLVAVPLVVVTVIRRGVLRAALVGAGIAVIPATARTLAGKPSFLADSAFYMPMALFLGLVLVRVLVGEVNRQAKESAARAEADVVAAEHVGRSDIVARFGEVFDELQKTILHLTAVGVDAAMRLRALVAQHKADVVADTRASAMYLRDLLRAYERSVNEPEPDLARHVNFEVSSQDGLLVLSRRQGAALTATLAAIRPTGDVTVRTPQVRPAEGLRIEVGTQTVVLKQAAPTPVRLALVPVAITGLALYILSMSNAAYAAVPWSLTTPLAVLVAGYAVLAWQFLHRYGTSLEPWLALGALAPFAIIAVLTAHAAQNTDIPRVTLIGPLAGLALLLGTVVRPKSAVIMAWAGLVAAAVAVIWSAPGVSARYASAELIWPVIAFLGGHYLTRAMARLGPDLAQAFAAQHRDQVERAQRAAARQEIEYLLDVLAEGEDLAEQAEPGPITTSVVGRLAELREDLHALATTRTLNDEEEP